MEGDWPIKVRVSSQDVKEKRIRFTRESDIGEILSYVNHGNTLDKNTGISVQFYDVNSGLTYCPRLYRNVGGQYSLKGKKFDDVFKSSSSSSNPIQENDLLHMRFVKGCNLQMKHLREDRFVTSTVAKYSPITVIISATDVAKKTVHLIKEDGVCTMLSCVNDGYRMDSRTEKMIIIKDVDTGITHSSILHKDSRGTYSLTFRDVFNSSSSHPLEEGDVIELKWVGGPNFQMKRL